MGADWPLGSRHTEIGGEYTVASPTYFPTSPPSSDPTRDLLGRLAESPDDFAHRTRLYVIF